MPAGSSKDSCSVLVAITSSSSFGSCCGAGMQPFMRLVAMKTDLRLLKGLPSAGMQCASTNFGSTQVGNGALGG